jgi:tetratricopeptide (TPR) repeat protein
VAIDREKIHVAAQKYVEKKRYDKAVIEYQKVIQEDPNDARTLLKIGDLQSKMDEYAGAVATYERVGRFYASQGFSLKAIAVYKQIREIISRHVPQLEEKYAHIMPKLAELYQQLGLTSDALSALDEVATRLQRQGRDGEAIDVFRKIVELDPSNPLPHLRLAEALSRGKDAEGAVAEFAVAAGQLARLGRRDDALKVFERLLQHKQEPAHARVAAELYLSRNAPNDGLQALAKLQICFQANPRDLDTLGLLGRAFNHIGQAAKAIEVQKEMARIARDTGKADLFHEIVGRLVKLAPNDEGVRRLASGSDAPAPPSSEAPRAAAPVEPRATSDAPAENSYEDVGDTDIDESEQPIDLSRRAGGPTSLADEDLDASVEVVEEPEPAAPEPTAQVVQILADAAAFRRARLPSKAVATLRAGLRRIPESLELREVLRDVLLEWGRPQDAAAEMVELAGHFVDALDVEAATRTLQDVLAIDPQHERALAMLRELGFEVVEEPSTTERTAEPVTATERLPTGLQQPFEEAYEAQAPLPSYDLDGARQEPPTRSRAVPPPALQGRPSPQLEEIDDPFGEAPLPSFPLDTPEDGARASAHRGEAATDGRASPPRSGAELESALEEADFFASRGLYDDARTILDEQLARLPNHPLLLERVAELEAQEGSIVGGSGTRPSPAAANVEDRSFDIAESLNSLDAGDRASATGAGPIGASTEQVDVEEVFAKFKEGVARQIGVDDAQSHYDLGLAYKDMGLVEDAVREFETAARDPRHACVCYSMIGMIQLELGNVNDAIDALTRGLQSPERTKDQEAALSYEIGAAYEVRKMNKQALEYFQRAARLIPGFRDVVERVRRLQKAEPKQPSRAVAVGADDEFDRAFDDILGKRP